MILPLPPFRPPAANCVEQTDDLFTTVLHFRKFALPEELCVSFPQFLKFFFV